MSDWGLGKGGKARKKLFERDRLRFQGEGKTVRERKFSRENEKEIEKEKESSSKQMKYFSCKKWKENG